MVNFSVESPCELLKVSFPEYESDIGALRIRAWRGEKGVNPSFFSQTLWTEPLDETAHHWVVRCGDRLVAAARLSFHETLDSVPYAHLLPPEQRAPYAGRRLASINRLVVELEFRGRGLAKLLDQARIDLARRQGADVIVAQPQLHRLKALEKRGFAYRCELQKTPEMPERPLFLMDYDLTQPA